MADDQHLAHLVEQGRRSGDALEKIAAATGAMAQDLRTMLSTTLTAALIYPWANDPSVVRVVLIQDAEEERRLRDALQRFDSSTDRNLPMDEWLKKEGFRLPVTKPVRVERRGIATYKATATHQGLSARPPAPSGEPPDPPLELEHNSP